MHFAKIFVACSRRLCLVLALTIAIYYQLPAQTRSPAAATPSPTTATPSPTAATPSPATQEALVGISSLAQSYLQRDIETSTFEELAARLRMLKLSDQGTRTELVARLSEHYGLKVTSSPAPGATTNNQDSTDNAMVVTIESASAAQYITIEEVSENYMRLSGGVVLSITDKKKGTLHHIEADEIMYNKQKEVMTARGHVVYKLTENNKTQTFTGNEMDFSLPDSDGVFLDGTMTKDQKIKDSNLTFVVKGSKISRNARNLVVLDKANLSSSTWDPPNYHIAASKIWILQPGEWALNDATLYVGRVPVFYLPFFFYPSDEVIFHPVAGYKTIEGAFLQTTTYLLGKKPAGTSSISFMQIDDGQSGDYDNRVHGMFMEKIPKKTSDTSATSNQGTGQFIKILADIYTTLGYFAAVQADLKSAKVPQLTFLAGIGFSKAIYSGYGGTFTSYYNGYREYWDQGYFGGLKIPFRFVLDLRTQVTLDNFTLTVALPLASDPYVKANFMNHRQEDIDWGKLLGVTKDTTVVPTYTQATSIDTMDMSVSMTATLNTPAFGQFLQYIKLSKFNLALSWKSQPWVSTSTPIPSEVSSAYQSANTNFYVPNLLTLPDMGLSFAGTLIQYPPYVPATTKPAAETKDKSAPVIDSKELLPPWEEKPATETKETSTATANPDDFRVPYRPPLSTSDNDTSTTKFNLGYTFDPGFGLETRFQGANATDPSAISSSLDYLGLKYALSGKLLYSFSLPQNYLTFDGNVAIDQRDGSLAQRPNSSVTDASIIYTTYAANRAFSLSDTSTLAVYPFRTVSVLQNSNVKYGITFLGYRYRNTGIDSNNNGTYVTDVLGWNNQMITSHFTSATLALGVSPLAFSLTGQFNLPPTISSLDLNSTLALWQANLTASEHITFANGTTDTIWGPIFMALTVPVGNWLTSTTNMTVDPELAQINNLTTTLKVFGLTASVTALQSQDEVFNTNGANLGWNNTGNLTLRLRTGSIGYDLTWVADPVWYNRITTSITTGISWSQDFIEITKSTLNYSLNWTFKIFEFLDFSIKVTGANNRMYRYIPAYNRELNLQDDRNFFMDLLRSFNFFNISDRYNSYFKLNTITLQLTHYSGDWQFDLSYTGNPVIRNGASTWDSTLNVAIAWKPIPEIATTINSYNDVTTVK